MQKKKEVDKNLPHKTESEKRPAVAETPFAV